MSHPIVDAIGLCRPLVDLLHSITIDQIDDAIEQAEQQLNSLRSMRLLKNLQGSAPRAVQTLPITPAAPPETNGHAGGVNGHGMPQRSPFVLPKKSRLRAFDPEGNEPREVIWRCLDKHPHLTVAEISEHTGLSRSKVSSTIGNNQRLFQPEGGWPPRYSIRTHDQSHLRLPAVAGA